MADVFYAPEADDDLEAIAAYIARDNPDAARNWIRLIREKCKIYATQPAMGEERHGFGESDCRSFSVGNYVVFFRAKAGGIEIARIIHGNRDLRDR